MDYMNNLGCCELNPQDAMNNSWLRKILMILSREPMALISINSSELWMILCHELRVVDDMNDSEL